MITKGKIISRVANSNKYNVYIPYFDVPGQKETYVEATLMKEPSINDSYEIDDIVFIGFEDKQASRPIILGKLFNDDSEDYDSSRGYAHLQRLKVDEIVELSQDLKIGDYTFNELLEVLSEKQNRLTAGNNITITEDGVISATYGNTSITKNGNNIKLEDILSAVDGYDSTKTQTLKNINGTFKWVDD